MTYALVECPERTVALMHEWYAPDGLRPDSPIDCLARARHRLAPPSPAAWTDLNTVREQLGLEEPPSRGFVSCSRPRSSCTPY